MDYAEFEEIYHEDIEERFAWLLEIKNWDELDDSVKENLINARNSLWQDCVEDEITDRAGEVIVND